jgi:hypothetical protein
VTSLAELGAAARHYAAFERRLFEVLGGWVPTAPEPEVKLVLRAHSFQHAWHAELWDDLAPRTGPAPMAGAGAGVGAGMADLHSVLDTVAARTSSVERLVGAYEVVLPKLVQAYTHLADRAQPASDGPLVRALERMLADDRRAVTEGESLRRRLVGTTEIEENAAVPGTP